jgi:hypothetical protein
MWPADGFVVWGLLGCGMAHSMLRSSRGRGLNHLGRGAYQVHIFQGNATMKINTRYDNTNRFVLFVNDRKEDDNDPDRTGSININGVEYFLNGWLKKDKKIATSSRGAQ